MSDLVAVAYDSEATAREVLDTLRRLQTEHVVELEDGVVVTKRRGREDQAPPVLRAATGAGAAGGALWGGLIGLIFLAPLLGAAIGAAAGGAAGALTDVGVDDKFMKELGAEARAGRRGADRARPPQHPRQGAPRDPEVRRPRAAELAEHRGRGAPRGRAHAPRDRGRLAGQSSSDPPPWLWRPAAGDPSAPSCASCQRLRARSIDRSASSFGYQPSTLTTFHSGVL